jgi:hypothetical protein
MLCKIRTIALVFAVSFGFFGVFTSPASAILPTGTRLMPVFRITPAMNGMRGMVGSMPMTGMASSMPMFNVQTGFVTMPRFPHTPQHELLRREFMMNRNMNAFNMGLGVGNMMGRYGSYPSMSGMGSYGSSPSMSSYGGGGGYGQMTSMPAASSAYEANPATTGLGNKTAEVSRILTAAGLSNEGGELSWPLGLQVLFPATENKQLLSQLNAGLQIAALQKSDGSVDNQALDTTSHAAARLREMLSQREPYLQSRTYREADRFLSNIEAALKQLQGNTTANR